MLWHLFNSITGHHYLIPCIFMIVLGAVFLLHEKDYYDATSAFSASMAGLMYPAFLLVTETESVRRFNDLTEELFFVGTLLEIVFLVFGFLYMPCVRRKKLRSLRDYLFSILIVLGYYSFGTVIGLGIRRIGLIHAFNTVGFANAFVFLIGVFIIWIST